MNLFALADTKSWVGTIDPATGHLINRLGPISRGDFLRVLPPHYGDYVGHMYQQSGQLNGGIILSMRSSHTIKKLEEIIMQLRAEGSLSVGFWMMIFSSRCGKTSKEYLLRRGIYQLCIIRNKQRQPDNEECALLDRTRAS